MFCSNLSNVMSIASSFNPHSSFSIYTVAVYCVLSYVQWNLSEHPPEVTERPPVAPSKTLATDSNLIVHSTSNNFGPKVTSNELH